MIDHESDRIYGVAHVGITLNRNDTVGCVLGMTFDELGRNDLRNVKIRDLSRSDLRIVMEYAFYEEFWNGKGTEIIKIVIAKPNNHP